MPETATPIWHNAGLQLDSVDPDRDMPADLENNNAFMPAAGPGQWVWCYYDEGPGCWVMLQPFEDVIRVKLTADWHACGQGTGILIARGNADEWLGFDEGYELELYDPLGVIATDLYAFGKNSAGQAYMPAGICAYVKRFADDNSLGAAAVHARNMHQ